MAKKLTTKTSEVKHTEHDYVTGFVVKVLRAAHANKKTMLALLLAVIVAFAGAFFYCEYQSKVKENSWKDLFMSVSFGDSAALDTVTKNYPGTDAALYAQFYKADALFEAGDYPASAVIFESIAKSSNKELSAVAGLSLASTYQAMEKYSDSIAAAKAFIDANPNHFGLAQAYLTLALSQDLNGSKKEALESYKLIETRFPGTYFATFASNKTKDLSKTK